MTEAREHYAYMDDLDPVGLHAKKEEILAKAPRGDFNLLSDDLLTELWAIYRALRRKAKTPTTRAASRKVPRTVEDLA